ncbi:MAG: diguanylate cyclase [Candidatus Woesearchaeota archaeon]
MENENNSTGFEKNTDLETILKINFPENVIHGTFLCDINQNTIFINDEFSKITGYSKEEIIGKKILNENLWFKKEDRKEYLKILDEFGRVDKAVSYFKKKDDKIIPVTISSTFNKTKKNETLGYQGILQDYSEILNNFFKIQLDRLMEKQINILDTFTSTDNLDELIKETNYWLSKIFYAKSSSIFLYDYEHNNFFLKNENYKRLDEKLIIKHDKNSRTPINYAIRMNKPLVVLNGKALVKENRESIVEKSRKIIKSNESYENIILKSLLNETNESNYKILKLDDLSLELNGNEYYEKPENFIIIPHVIKQPINKLTGVICLSNINSNEIFTYINQLENNPKGIGSAKKFAQEFFVDESYQNSIHNFFLKMANRVATNIGTKIKSAQNYSIILDQSERDHLTGLYNQRKMHEILSKDFNKVKKHNNIKCEKRKGIKKDLSLIMLDLDDFKEINDRYGHDIGDLTLKKIGNRLYECVRDDDYIFRYGGEEFLISLYNADLNVSKKISKRLLDTISKYVSLDIKKDLLNKCVDEKKLDELIPRQITASIGISNYNENKVKTYQELIKNADLALYNSKKCGKNRFCCYDKTLVEKLK